MDIKDKNQSRVCMNKTATTAKFPCPFQQFGPFSLPGIKPLFTMLFIPV